MTPDASLIYAREQITDGATVHRIVHLVGIYRGSIARAKTTGEAQWYEFASEVEADLRQLLARHRLSTAAF